MTYRKQIWQLLKQQLVAATEAPESTDASAKAKSLKPPAVRDHSNRVFGGNNSSTDSRRDVAALLVRVARERLDHVAIGLHAVHPSVDPVGGAFLLEVERPRVGEGEMLLVLPASTHRTDAAPR